MTGKTVLVIGILVVGIWLAMGGYQDVSKYKPFNRDPDCGAGYTYGVLGQSAVDGELHGCIPDKTSYPMPQVKVFTP